MSLLACATLFLSACPENKYDADTWINKLGDAKQLDRSVKELENLCNPKAIDPLGKAWDSNNKPTTILTVIIELSAPLTKTDPSVKGSDGKPVPGDAEVKFCTDYVKSGRNFGYMAAMPYLKEAIEGVDKNSQRSIDDAVKAADAIGDAAAMSGDPKYKDYGPLTDEQLGEFADILIGAVHMPGATAQGKEQRVRLTAIAALAKFPDLATKKKTVKVLGDVVRADASTQPPQIVGAAINTLGDMRQPEALPILIEAMYRAPLFFQQVHRALVASGQAVVGEIGKILRHEHNDVNALFKDKKLDKYCGDPGDTPAAPSDCQDVSAMDYYAALVAGDLHDKALVPDLITALNRKPVPAYYQDFNPGPPAQNAVLDSLRKIGDPSSADAVLKIAGDPKADENLRPIAISVYGFVSKDGSEKTGNTTGLKMLASIAADNGADTGLRLAASESYARLANDAGDAKVLAVLAKKYYDASNDAQKERTAVASDYDAKKKAFDDLRDPFLKAQADVERAKIKYDDAKKLAGNDPKKIPKNISDAVETARQTLNEKQKTLEEARAAWSKAGPEKAFKAAEAEYNKAGNDYNEIKAKLEKAKGEAGGDVTKVDPDLLNEAAYDKQYWEWLKTNVYLPTKQLYDALNQKSDGYKGYERGFENHIARIEIVIHCKGDAKCYADSLDEKPADAYARFKALMPSFKDDKGKALVDVDDKQWTDDDKNELRVAQIERAMLELRKLGDGARPQMDKVLAHLTETDRLIRESILLALPRISPMPCPQCKTALDDAVEKAKGKQELDGITYETQLLSNLYAWAGGK